MISSTFQICVIMEQLTNANLEDKTTNPFLVINQLPHDHFPKQYIWPKNDNDIVTEVLNAPVIDLHGFFIRDEEAIANATNLEKGVIAHANRFSENLPWKEMLSFKYHENSSEELIVDFFHFNKFGQVDHNILIQIKLIYQKCYQSMRKLALDLMELLEISLGVDEQNYFKRLYEDCISLVRWNYYPKSNHPSLMHGVGRHHDPNTITVLYRDQVGGLEVFVDNKWRSVTPYPRTLVVNIGDTFKLKALSNGKYVSCLYRLSVNRFEPRLSVAFFLSPKGDKDL
ncbi:hypothetical protein OSB04_003504 [Centaurea solstitialis]|uniref:Fe2OG dioxygenase domain-containing protein n=1 Tax=Centaurea solstitialis TaxID=347529 RepID=A0AA38TV06_9ASTR|nr:hypothetical protein OSB04_003504 [Centaurea solstitialis]